MKALVYEGIKQLELRELETPEPLTGEHLIRVAAVGICGSDMHAYLGHDERRPAPLVLGHEAAGTIVGGPRDGERVTINPLVTCGDCDACRRGNENLCEQRQIISMPPRAGAFAQYVCMPERNLVPVPDGVELSKAALVEPIACGWHAARKAGEVVSVEGAASLVIGAGAIGVGAALCLRAMNASNVLMVEPNADRAAFVAEKTGFEVCSPNAFPDDTLVDLVVDGVGYASTREMASKFVRPGGVIAHIGLGESLGGLDIRRMTLQEITFVGTYTYTAHDFRQTAQALFKGRLGALDWIEIRPLEEGACAFSDLVERRAIVPKIILDPWLVADRT